MNNQEDKINAVVTISIITATLNSRKVLPQLVADLQSQSDFNFIWIVVDGGSTDGTVQSIPEGLPFQVDCIIERDFGIYDAMNKGVRRCVTDYYLVIGSDDRLEPGAVAEFKRLAKQSGSDLIAACVRDAGRVKPLNQGKSWLRGHHAYIAQHSVGTMIKHSLHSLVGEYSREFPIAADQLFIKMAIAKGATVHFANDFVAGTFGRDGVSSSRYLACLFEFTLVQLRTEKLRSLQLLILLFRIVRHWRKALSGY